MLYYVTYLLIKRPTVRSTVCIPFVYYIKALGSYSVCVLNLILMNSGRKGTFYCNWLKDNHETNGNYHYSREEIVPTICIKKPSEEPLTSVFSVVKIKMVSTILLLENYENH